MSEKTSAPKSDGPTPDQIAEAERVAQEYFAYRKKYPNGRGPLTPLQQRMQSGSW